MTENPTPHGVAGRTRFKQWCHESYALWFILAFVTWIHLLPPLGLESLIPDTQVTWDMLEYPWRSEVLVLFCAVLLIALGSTRPEQRRVRWVLRVVAVLGGVAGALFFPPAIMLWSATSDWVARAGPAPPPRALGPNISAGFLLVPLVLAVAAALVHIRWKTGAWLPADSPTERLLRSHHYLSAAPVASKPVEGASRTLVLPPEPTREQLLAHVRREDGWEAAEVLQRLNSRERLASLPLTEEARVRALPLDSPLLVTREGRPLTPLPLWGVVVEAENLQKQRLLLLSLGAGEPPQTPAAAYSLLFEESVTGGPPRLLEARHVFPEDFIYDTRRMSALVVIYAMVFLLAAIPLAAAAHNRALRAQRPAEGSRTEP